MTTPSESHRIQHLEFFEDLQRASQDIRRNSEATARALEEMKQTASQIMIDMERAKIVRQEQLREFHQNAGTMQATLDNMTHTESGRRR